MSTSGRPASADATLVKAGKKQTIRGGGGGGINRKDCNLL